MFAFAPSMVTATKTGFILATDVVCATFFGGSTTVNGGSTSGAGSVPVGGVRFGEECFSGTSAVGENAWNCGTLQSPKGIFEADGDNTFHVHGGRDGTFCGVKGGLDAYRDCDNCDNFGLYVSDGSGNKVGYCYPVPIGSGGMEKTCYAPLFSTDIWREYMFCDIDSDEIPTIC
jgi:hypothetical protein